MHAYLDGLKLVPGPLKVRPNQDPQGRTLVHEPVNDGKKRKITKLPHKL